MDTGALLAERPCTIERVRLQGVLEREMTRNQHEVNAKVSVADGSFVSSAGELVRENHELEALRRYV
jgi:hypothetical protein